VLECELDGGGERRVMWVSGTGGEVLRVVGLKVTNGDTGSYGGGMYINGGTVELAMLGLRTTRLM